MFLKLSPHGFLPAEVTTEGVDATRQIGSKALL